MRTNPANQSAFVSVVFDVLDPAAFGCFVAAMIFDVAYAKAADVLWLKSASWLIALGLLFAVLPRLINLARVWFPVGARRRGADVAAFWLNLVGILAAIVNAFVHSRDAYAAIPDGVWLSVVTVVLLVVSNIVLTLQPSRERVPS